MKDCQEITNIPKIELLEMMEEMIAKGWDVFVKWECELCHERVTLDSPNCFYTCGFLHTLKENGERCGKISYPDKFGLLVMKEKK